MRKINYKNLSQDLDRMVKPGNSSGRVSIGLDMNVGEYYFIEVDNLIPFKNQAREFFNEHEISSLAESIKMHGIRQPLTIVPSLEHAGKYEVVSGERRLRAAIVVGLTKVPCIIIKDNTNAEEIAIIENIHRKDLHPIELGNVLKKLLTSEVFKSQVDIVNKLSLPKSTVSECITLSGLDKSIKDYLISKNIKTRDILRKAIKYIDKPEIIKSFLGINGKTKGAFSVMRVVYENDSFSIQCKGLKKLSIENKEKLKDEINLLLEKL